MTGLKVTSEGVEPSRPKASDLKSDVAANYTTRPVQSQVAKVRLELTASLGLSLSGLPIAYRAISNHNKQKEANCDDN